MTKTSSTVATKDLALACSNCKKLCANAKTVCMSGRGPKRNADIMVVGEAPDEVEDSRGSAFVGASSRYLDLRVFDEAGIDDTDSIRFTYAVRCKPPKGKVPNLAEIRNCLPNLEQEIRQVKPKVIVALGAVALNALIPMTKFDKDDEATSGKAGGISKWRGHIVWNRKFNCWVIPTWHPFSAMSDERGNPQLRQPPLMWRKNQMIKDFKRALKYVRMPPPEFTPPKTFLVQTSARAKRVLIEALKQKKLVIDIETEGFSELKDEVLGVAFAWSTSVGFYLTWDAICQSKEVYSLFSSILVGKGPIKIFHNSSFDEKFLRVSKRLKFGGVSYDTLLAARIVDENFPAGLKPLSWRWGPNGGYEDELVQYRIKHQIKSFKDIPVETTAVYAAQDATETFRLWETFEPIIASEGYSRLFYDIITPVRSVMTDIEVNGFPIDLVKAKKLDRACTIVKQKLLLEVKAEAGDDNFNPNSPKQLTDMLFNKLKLKPLKKTKSKKSWSTDKESLEFIAKQKKGHIAKLLLDMKYVSKQQNTFIKLVLRDSWPDQKVHPHYNLSSEVTGRTACKNPGIHNIPRDGLIRSLFIGSKGHKLVYADVKSAELRVLAIMCGEPALLNAFREGRDLHDETYRIMYNKAADYKPTDDERFIAKSINFGLIYGRGARSLATLLGITPEEAQALIDRYFERLPKVASFIQKNRKQSRKRKYAVSIFGRRRHLQDFYDTDSAELQAAADRYAGNAPVQGGAADYVYLVLTFVSKEIKKRKMRAQIVHTVHDCIIVNTPDEEVEEMSQIIRDCFARKVTEITVPMAVDVKVVQSWGEHNDSRLRRVLKQHLKVA